MATTLSADKPALSRIYRPDFAVRLRLSDLSKIEWQHGFSFADRGILAEAPWSSVRAGSTEWTGMLNGALVSLGWDWFVFANGDVSLLKAVAPRRNIRLLDDKGYDQDDAIATIAIWAWLENGFWHDAVKSADEEDQADWLT